MAEEKINIIIQELVRRANEEGRRLRSLEQRMEVVESRTNTLETTALLRQRKINDKLNELELQIKNISDDVIRVRNIIEKISRQSGKFAKKSDVQEIERMFDLLSPVRHKPAAF